MDLDRDDLHEPAHALSSTAEVTDALQLYGYRPRHDEPDPRPAPDAERAAGAIADIFDAHIATLSDTCLEPDLEGLLWGQVDLFHRAIDRLARRLDDNEQAQRRSQEAQDGSEIRSVELEALIADGGVLIERRNVLESLRDIAAGLYERHTGAPWRARTRSMLNHRAMTAATIDSRDFINAKRWADKELLMPPGAKILFSCGDKFNDVDAIWRLLDQVRAKYPDMVLVHTAGKTGGDHIAGLWAANRNITAMPLHPDWRKYSRAQAPFKRNDFALALMPKAVITFPGGGIQANLYDKARAMGLRTWDYEREKAKADARRAPIP
ncbi:MAG: hypothetical protein A4S17_00560 [Proteobacteria bacterium HN_bin10]|nr:MAG: hypothetical protein A4S17_00560 [Proteobacteria bacterium HN_bin10]